MIDMKKKFNPKKILSYALLLVLIVFIVVLTWVPLVFDIEHLDVNKWITNSLINVGIMICAIVLGEIFGEDRQKEKVDGLYQKALRQFNDLLAYLTDERKIIVYFSQFYIWYKARELKKKKEGYLVDHGFGQLVAHLIVEYIEKDDLDEMKKGVFIKVDEKTGKEIKFKRITDDQYDVLCDIFSIDFTIDSPSYTYYLSSFGDSSSVSTLEQAKKIEKKERLNKIFNRIFKILLSLFISFIWGMATVKDITAGGAEAAAANTMTRLLALIGGLLSGFFTSIVAVKLASQKLENKAQVLKFMEIHYDNKEFVPKSYEELVEEEIKEEEEERAKQVTPEVVEKNVSEEQKPIILPLLETKSN